MSLTAKQEEIRERAEADLETFIRLVHPLTVLGSVHQELCQWMTREGKKSHQLILLPRDHAKSRTVAYAAAWMIAKNPTIRILYISSTQNLATKQLKFIKDILTSKIFRRYWPEHIEEEEGKREKWTESEISIDHPDRRLEAVRDPTVFTAGLTTGITGMHCDLTIMDDVVVYENAYTDTGRDKVETQYSLLSSIEGADAQQWVVGTRYHPQDLYNSMLETTVDVPDEDGNIIESKQLYEVFERQVEDSGMGIGEFLWPRQQRYDGKWFGFNTSILARKKAQYKDPTQFRAQYYNNPNEEGKGTLTRDLFQYYKTGNLQYNEGLWYYNGERLNVFAAIDFAFSTSKKADYTALVVVGVDFLNNLYVLEIDRFRSDSIKEYFNRVLKAYNKWGFRKLRAEVNSAQIAIVKSLKEDYIKPFGLALSVDEFRPTVREGSKEERIQAILHPKYENLQVFHYRGGNCQTLEEELVLTKPPHDDVKDALSSAVDICVAPYSSSRLRRKQRNMFHNRFGGVAL